MRALLRYRAVGVTKNVAAGWNPPSVIVTVYGAASETSKPTLPRAFSPALIVRRGSIPCVPSATGPACPFTSVAVTYMGFTVVAPWMASNSRLRMRNPPAVGVVSNLSPGSFGPYVAEWIVTVAVADPPNSFIVAGEPSIAAALGTVVTDGDVEGEGVDVDDDADVDGPSPRAASVPEHDVSVIVARIRAANVNGVFFIDGSPWFGCRHGEAYAKPACQCSYTKR